MAKDETAVGSSLKAGKEWTRPGESGDGYYLFVSDGLTNPAKPNTGTSPIFAIVGGDPVVVTEKTSIPTVTKKVRMTSLPVYGPIRLTLRWARMSNIS